MTSTREKVVSLLRYVVAVLSVRGSQRWDLSKGKKSLLSKQRHSWIRLNTKLWDTMYPCVRVKAGSSRLLLSKKPLSSTWNPGQPIPSPVPSLTRSSRPRQRRKMHVIDVALVGNPNCGKTTLFNFASGSHEHVGNFGGVTVDSKSARLEQNGYTFNITDLPGTYSLTAYTPEELFVRDHLLTHSSRYRSKRCGCFKPRTQSLSHHPTH